MGGTLFGFYKTNDDDPNNVMVAPNLSGFNRVIISLPPNVGLSIDEILTDLVDVGFLNGIEEHDKIENDHFVIKRETERDTKSLITHPETTTHSRLNEKEKKELGINKNLIRLSVGLENPEDIIEDIDNSLRNLK